MWTPGRTVPSSCLAHEPPRITTTLGRGGTSMDPAGDRPDLVTPPRPPSGPAAPGDGLRLLALVGLTVALIALCALLAVPFLPALTWGVALAVMTWPLHGWVSRQVARPGVAAALSTAA